MSTNLKTMRWHIGIFGRTNTGKSSFINWLSQQEVSIVSSLPGTTTDPVEKTMELLPLGPVVLFDTAGVDDATELGQDRIKKTQDILGRIDMAILVSEGNHFGDYEKTWMQRFKEKNVPCLLVLNKADLSPLDDTLLSYLETTKQPYLALSSLYGSDDDRERVKQMLFELLPDKKWLDKPLLDGMLNAGDLVVLVIPIDKSAPKGRIILPQQQVIREVLDRNAISMVIVPEQIPQLEHYLRRNADLMITDSQAFGEVFKLCPAEIPLTSFSILFARQRGQFEDLLEGAYQLRKLKKGDKVLIMEACSHHPTTDDIGRIKLPRWLNEYVGSEIKTQVVCGHSLPQDLRDIALVIQCGSCMLNMREVYHRIQHVKDAGLTVTNYGLAIAEMKGHLDRAIRPLGLMSSARIELGVCRP
jgi:[FeFe] hydrogenase H-cluster maturation GTPase HydF